MAARSGSHALTGKRRHGLGWLPWLAVLLLVLVALATYLIVHHADQEDNGTAPNNRQTTSQARTRTTSHRFAA